MTLTMYDDTNVDLIPHDAAAVAGYVGGHWPTYRALEQRFPHALRLSIAVNSHEDAECLDIEKGDATPDVAPGWVRRQQARGVHLPVLYASRSDMPHVIVALRSAGIGRSEVRLWSAHWGAGKHICAPTTCGAPFSADATQWTNRSHGASLDESLVLDDFFHQAHVQHGPRDLARGMHGHDVVTLKKHLHKRGYRPPRRLGRYPHTFGVNTEAFVEHFQHHHGLPVDGIVGPHTRKALGLQA